MKKLIILFILSIIVHAAIGQAVKVPNLPKVTGAPQVKDSDLFIDNKHDSVGSAGTVSRQTCVIYAKDLRNYINTTGPFQDTNHVNVQYVHKSNSGDTVRSNGRQTLIDSSANISVLKIVFPQSPSNGQIFSIGIIGTVTTLTLYGGIPAAGAPTIFGTISTTSNNSSGGWVYIGSCNSWFRR